MFRTRSRQVEINMPSKRVLFVWTCLLLMGSPHAAAADHKAAVQIHNVDPCDPNASKSDNPTRKLIEVDERGTLCCGCPKDSYYAGPCEEFKFYTTKCYSCPVGYELNRTNHMVRHCVLKLPDVVPTIEPTLGGNPPDELRNPVVQTPNAPNNGTGKRGGELESQPAPLNGWWFLMGAILLVAVAVAVAVLCFCYRDRICDICCKCAGSNYQKNVGSHTSSESGRQSPNLEAGLESSVPTIATSNSTPQATRDNKRDNFDRVTYQTESPDNPRRDRDKKKLTASKSCDTTEELTYRSEVFHSDLPEGKNMADRLETPYHEPATISEPPTRSRYPEQASSGEEEPFLAPNPPQEGRPPMPPFHTTLPVAEQQRRIRVCFGKFYRARRVKLERDDVRHCARHFDLTPDQLDTAERKAGTVSGFLAEVFGAACSRYASEMTAEKVLRFFYNNEIMDVYEYLLQDLRAP